MADSVFYRCEIEIVPALSEADTNVFDALTNLDPLPEAQALLQTIQAAVPRMLVTGQAGLISLTPERNGFNIESEDSPEGIAAWMRLLLLHFFQVRGYAVRGRIAWTEDNDANVSGYIFVNGVQVEVIEDDWLLNRGPSWDPVIVADDELKQALSDLVDSADATGCSEDLTVVSSEAVVRLRRYLKRD